MDPRLLEILVCPLCKGALTHDRAAHELICHVDKLAYPIRDGIPVMIVEQARQTVEGKLLEPVAVSKPE
ncbi:MULTISPECIES: Trm112 family protein [unclassified Mycoavidus]|uniref:Trm112 family protein n=1 Tax=unclassified Mycoavidus TaxID=2649241 RepID=UPI001CC0369D|nr:MULTISPECIES: Trm112 family protein [unclassified Mycoavidus]UAW64020.1 Trm112 family protein [Mycoavidus sp. HKI]UUM21438.1 Trm112 family protein [Mycoavidus sp. SF9855]